MAKRGTKRTFADRADQVARDLEADTYSTVRPLLRNPRAYGQLIVRLDDQDTDAEEFSRQIERTLSPDEWATLTAISDMSQNTPGEDAVQLARWGRHRIVYAIDPDAADAIVHTDWANTVIPGDVLSRLPHPDPMIVLPHPIEWLNTEGLLEQYEAFGVFGVRGARRRCSTHHPDATHLALHFFGHLLDPDTRRRVRVPVPGRDGTVHTSTPVVGMRTVIELNDATMESRQRLAIADMWNAGPFAAAGFHSVSEAEAGMSQMTRTGLALLVYLVSDNADTRGAPSRRSRAGRHATNDADGRTHVFEVGFRIGAALRDAARSSSGKRAGEPRTVSPHIRRAHLHTFRRGPGRKERFVKWLAPIAVNPTDKASDTTTVHVR